MVYVNSKKFACESCIKGHRSSSCHHTDRPLFEIKKKGRPVSQCEKCRELRQSKKVHSKCTCNPKADPASRGEVLASVTSKSRRFIPIVPALPNGLRDVLAASQVRSSLPPNARQRVDSLLNPCNCKSVWKCDCRQVQSSTDTLAPESTGDLATLAHMASIRSLGNSPRSSSSSAFMPLDLTAKITLPKTNSVTASSPASSTKRHTSRPPTPKQGMHKRSKQHHNHISGRISELNTTVSLAGPQCLCGTQCVCLKCAEHRGTEHAGKDLHGPADGKCRTCFENHNRNHCIRDSPSPPLELPPIQSATESSIHIPDFGFMPPISTITSLAGTGCTCGVQCACPGCVEHRGLEHAAKDLHDCADGKCGTCVDNHSGIALPASTSPFSSTSAVSTSASAAVDFVNNSASLNRFYARAAALPPPPLGRRMRSGVRLDPCDIGNASPVNLPKLECCGGSCSCPIGQCTCGSSCGGCCLDTDAPSHTSEAISGAHQVVPAGSSSETGAASQPTLTIPITPLSSCCG